LPPPTRRNETKLQEKKRKREEEKAIAKIKASKQFQRRRRGYDPEDLTDEDEAARAIFEANVASLPGQMENCELCEIRFTVTAYSRTGPNGGLLCPECSKELDKEDGAKKKKKAAARPNRRQFASQILDGIYRSGAKDLMTLCIETLAKNVDLAEDFGDLPLKLIDKLAAILSKKRLITSTTLDLFIKSAQDTVTIYEGANLNSDDFIRIFQMMPILKHFRTRNAIQFKNQAMDYLTGCTVTLESFSIHGANLIDDEHWNTFLLEKGRYLKALKVYYTDGHFGDEQLELLKVTCPDLVRLKVSHNQKVTDEGIKHIASLPTLQHLSLEIYKPTSSEPYVEILNNIGNGLRTFSLETVHYIDDSVLEAIHENCIQLSKLRITDNETFTDAGFVFLFEDWSNPPLTYIDFSKARHIDATQPSENKDKVGLCSDGFEALMAHSGSQLVFLNVMACRHISKEAFENVFAENKKYPELRHMDVSFCWGVNDFVVGSIFRSCPNLKTLKIFGNMKVSEVKVPKGKILIGMPNAIGMQIEGEDD
jgi:DNA repair protein RAD7